MTHAEAKKLIKNASEIFIHTPVSMHDTTWVKVAKKEMLHIMEAHHDTLSYEMADDSCYISVDDR